MRKIIDTVKRIGGAAGAATTLFELAFQVDGKPLRERDKPGAVRVFGLPLFERDESLDRYWFGVIPRGKSKLAKRVIAEREGGAVK